MRSLVGRATRLAVAGAAGASLVVATAPVARATDIGDGYAGCGYQEICYSHDANGKGSGHEYYWTGDDNGKWWNYGLFGGWSSQDVHDNMSAVWNRDSKCAVRVEDFKDNTTTIRNYQMFVRNDSGWRNAVWNDSNDHHTRMNCI